MTTATVKIGARKPGAGGRGEKGTGPFSDSPAKDAAPEAQRQGP